MTTTDNPKALRECPFCGGAEVRMVDEYANRTPGGQHHNGPNRYWVHCDGCTALIQVNSGSQHKLKTTWNARHSDHDLRLKNLEILSLSEQIQKLMSSCADRERRGAERMLEACKRYAWQYDLDGAENPHVWAEWNRRRGEG